MKIWYITWRDNPEKSNWGTDAMSSDLYATEELALAAADRLAKEYDAENEENFQQNLKRFNLKAEARECLVAAGINSEELFGYSDYIPEREIPSKLFVAYLDVKEEV